jgi:mono/diheme cytochrome c family protein
LWLAATLGSAAIAFAAGQFPIDPGEKIVNTACVACHELRPIETTALDKEGWTKVVNAMREKGAEVKAEDLTVLVSYLATAYGPLPDGPGKAVMLNVCTQCHTLDRVKTRGATREEWDELLMHMLNEGAPLTDRDYPVILNYLARYFTP